MGLSSLLVSAKVIDKELDELFKSNANKAARVISVTGSSEAPCKKRKLESVEEVPKSLEKSKRPKLTKGKHKQEMIALDEDNNSEIENTYFGGKRNASTTIVADNNAESQSDFDPSQLVHESLNGKSVKPGRSASKQKYVPPGETDEQRNQRTLFVGNLPNEIAQNRGMVKKLHRHILSYVTTAKIESTRFRSVPFNLPTSKLSDSAKTKDGKDADKKIRSHNLQRTTAWRSQNTNDTDEKILTVDEKKFLNPNQKKKIAFINHQFHSEADTVHAYVVLAHQMPAENWPSNLPPPRATMDPYEAAKVAAKECDGSLFLERMIRVDVAAKTGDSFAHSGARQSSTDPKLSIFVGNLDFGTHEEDLRTFFESLIQAERGSVSTKGNDDDDEEIDATATKSPTWVKRVRIVRDKDTQLGKGFAYVQFLDRECVDEVLCMDTTKLKFAKRKLRVQRCKVIPVGAAGQTGASGVKLMTNDKPRKTSGAPIVIPKGDPHLGEKLAHMPKEERKRAKAADSDRVARRLAKKKSKMALGMGMKAKGMKKIRERVRKGSSTGKPPKVKSGKREGKQKTKIPSKVNTKQ